VLINTSVFQDDEIDADFMPEESAHPSQPSIPPFYLNLQILGRFLSQSGYRSARIQEQVFAQEKYFEEVKTPQINGSELLNGGEFGRIGQRLTKKEHSLAWNLLSQQSSNGRIHREDIATVWLSVETAWLDSDAHLALSTKLERDRSRRIWK
jgi:hypothetical protein